MGGYIFSLFYINIRILNIIIMRTSSAIREKLQQNAARIAAIRTYDSLNRLQQIELDYLQMEAETFQLMLEKAKKSWWKRLVPRKSIFFMITLLAMSAYVVSIFEVFDQMDLSKVKQWEFAVTAMPFWLMMALIPMAFITILTSKER